MEAHISVESPAYFQGGWTAIGGRPRGGIATRKECIVNKWKQMDSRDRALYALEFAASVCLAVFSLVLVVFMSGAWVVPVLGWLLPMMGP